MAHVSAMLITAEEIRKREIMLKIVAQVPDVDIETYVKDEGLVLDTSYAAERACREVYYELFNEGFSRGRIVAYLKFLVTISEYCGKKEVVINLHNLKKEIKKMDKYMKNNGGYESLIKGSVKN